MERRPFSAVIDLRPVERLATRFLAQRTVARAVAMLKAPEATWLLIRKETFEPSQIYREYLVPLAAVPAVATLIGRALIGMPRSYGGMYRTPLLLSLLAAVLAFCLPLLGVFIASRAINALAPNFAGSKNAPKAFKLTAYSWTPFLVMAALNIYPPWSVVGFVGGLYGIYLLYLGLPVLMDCPAENTLGYTIVAVVVMLTISIAVHVASGGIGVPSVYQPIWLR